MRSQNTSLTRPLAIALVIFTGTLLPTQPASAQILELATGALSILNSVTRGSQPQPAPQVAPTPVPIPQPQPSPKFTVGAGNLNGNRINLCVSNCLPSGTPVYAPGTAVQQPIPTAQ